MLFFTNEGRLSGRFSPVPGLPSMSLPPIHPQDPASDTSSRRGRGGGVELEEGCFLTKSIRYTHQLSHWADAVRRRDPRPIVSR